MKKHLLFLLLAVMVTSAATAQSPKTDLYDLVKKMMYDSNGYEQVGDWAVGNPKKFPVKWKEDKITMSPDTAINFYRMGTTEISINGKTFMQAGQPVKWNIMLKGARSGYSSFSLISSPSIEIKSKYNIDSLFGKKTFKAKLLKSCDGKDLAGYYYYEVKMPKKDPAFIKFSWLYLNGNTALRIDCYDGWSKYAVKLDCK